MKKVFAVTKVAALLTVFLFFTLLFTTCGGGAAGGAGGASIPDSEYSTHNAGGWGGGGSSGGSGGSSSGGNGVNMTGGTPLVVERYEDPVTGTFAGSQLNDLIAAIQNNSSRSNSVFNIPFYVVGDPVVRQARVTKGRTKVEKFEHQYKASCSIPPSTTPSVFYYYVEEGINLASITTAEMTGWQCLEDGSVHNGSHITNITGDVSLVPVYAYGAGPINAGVIKTDLHSAAIPDVGEIWDYAQQTGVQDGTAYITVPPPPMTALYNENGSAVTWSGNYVVNININSTPIEFTFSSGDTQSKQITNIPVGATISASATINVTGSSRYASLTTPQLSTTIQAGGNLDMYFSYPYTCHIPSSLQSYTVAPGVNSGAYKNNGTPTDISSKRPTPESFEYNGQTLYFIGWSRNAADTVPEIAGDSIPANGTYHGALDLYAIFSSCSVSISIQDQTGLHSNILAESSLNDHITLTASTAGDLPENSTYSWTIESPSSNPPVSLSSDSGQSITVTPVTGRTGSATIKVTASGGGHTASKTIDVQVVAIALQETVPIVLEPNETATLHASVVGGYSGGIDYSWQVISGSSVSVPNNNSSDNTITANSGGKTTITVTPCIDGTQYLGSKTIDVYVFDLQLTGDTGTIVTETPSSFSDYADYDFIMDASRVSGGTLTANLAGFSPSEVSFTWENNATALGTFGTINSSGNSCTITPNGTTGYYVINLQASITGVAGTTKVFKVRYKTLGLEFTNTSPTAISKNTAPGTGTTMTVEVKGFSSGYSISWGDWVSSATSVASKGTETKPANTDTATLVLTPLTGGKTTVSMSATIGIGANTLTLNATKDVYVLDLQLVSDSFSPPNSYNIAMTSSATDFSTVTASLAGTGMPSTTYTWTLGTADNSSTVLELQGSNNNSRTIKPKAAGTGTVTVSATCGGGVTVSKTINVSVAGISLPASPIVLTKGGSTQTITPALIGYSGPVSWTWNPPDSSIATLSGSGDTGTITPVAGGKTTLTVSTNVNGRPLSKSIDVYVLDLTLSGSTGAGVVNSTDANIDYDLIMNAADTTGKELTASLAGFTSGVTYTWDQPSPYATLNYTDRANNIIRASGTAGTTNFHLTASIDGVAGASITKTIKLKAAGLTLEGDDTLYYNPYDATHRLSLALTPVGDVELECILDDPSAYASSNPTVATASWANSGARCYVTGENGGTTNITVQAKIRGTDIILTARKQITILKLDITGLPIYPLYTELPLGQSQEVTAVLTGASDPSAVTYNWDSTESDLILSTTTESTITVTPMSGVGGPPKTITVTATMSGTDYGPITLGIMPKNITAGSLQNYLDNLSSGNIPDEPVTLPAIDFTISQVSQIQSILHDTNKYVDLSETTLPAGSVGSCFQWCKSVVVAPSIPEGVTSLNACFDHGECTSQLRGPSTIVIPESVTDMFKCFFKCTALRNVNIVVKARINDSSKWTKAFMHIETSQNVTVWVPNTNVKTAIENAEGNTGVTIRVGSGP